MIITASILVIYFFNNRHIVRRRNLYDDDRNYDSNFYSEVADTYMKMLEEIKYSKNTVKNNECAICLAEYKD